MTYLVKQRKERTGQEARDFSAKVATSEISTSSLVNLSIMSSSSQDHLTTVKSTLRSPQ
jgi:hypothetical protein